MKIWGPGSSALQVIMILTQCRFNARPPSPGAGQHPFNTLQWIVLPCYRVSLRSTLFTGCRPTHPIPLQCWDRVTAHCWFNVGQSSTPLAQYYSNTGPAHHDSRGPTNACTPRKWSKKLSTTVTSKQNKFDVTPASTAPIERLTNVASMLIQRVWRRPNNNPTLTHFPWLGLLYTLRHSTARELIFDLIIRTVSVIRFPHTALLFPQNRAQTQV